MKQIVSRQYSLRIESLPRLIPASSLWFGFRGSKSYRRALWLLTKKIAPRSQYAGRELGRRHCSINELVRCLGFVGLMATNSRLRRMQKRCYWLVEEQD